jgi:hypothetical protein
VTRDFLQHPQHEPSNHVQDQPGHHRAEIEDPDWRKDAADRIDQPVGEGIDRPHPFPVRTDAEPRADHPDEDRSHEDGEDGTHQDLDPDSESAVREQDEARRGGDQPLGEAQQQEPTSNDEAEKPERRILGASTGADDPAFQWEEYGVAYPPDQLRPGAERVEAAATHGPMGECYDRRKHKGKEDDAADSSIEKVEEHGYSPTSIGRWAPELAVHMIVKLP